MSAPGGIAQVGRATGSCQRRKIRIKMMMNESKKEFPRFEPAAAVPKEIRGRRVEGEGGRGRVWRSIIFLSQKLALFKDDGDRRTDTHTHQQTRYLDESSPPCLRGRLRSKKDLHMYVGTPYIAHGSVSGRVEFSTLATDMKKGLSYWQRCPFWGYATGLRGCYYCGDWRGFFFFSRGLFFIQLIHVLIPFSLLATTPLATAFTCSVAAAGITGASTGR